MPDLLDLERRVAKLEADNRTLRQALRVFSTTVVAVDKIMRIANALSLRWRNAADSADKPVLQLNTSDQVVIFSAGQGVRIINNAQDTILVNVSDAGEFSLLDGITAPTAVSGRAFLYVDTADGDLKVRFGDNVTKTLATDT